MTVSGGGLSRVFQVDRGVTASISGVTMTGGNAGIGGGLYNEGTTTLTNCTVSGNSASHGGGLYNCRHGHAEQLLPSAETPPASTAAGWSPPPAARPH